MNGMLIAAHYDFAAGRCVKCYEFAVSHDPFTGKVEWRYARSKHLLILRVGQQFWGVSLATGRRHEAVPEHLLRPWQCPRKSSRHHPLRPLRHKPAPIAARILAMPSPPLLKQSLPI